MHESVSGQCDRGTQAESKKRSISGTIQEPPLTHEFLNTSASHRWLNVEQVNDTVLVDICFRLVVTASDERLDIEQILVSRYREPVHKEFM